MPTSHMSLKAPKTLGVFDLETRLDPTAAAAAGYKGAGMPAALQRIATACMLVATEHADGSWTDLRLDTFADPLTEFDILMKLDGRLAFLAEADGMICTYNGRAHDLAVLRRRGARHWMFGLPGIAKATTMDHMDVMLRQRLGRQDGTPTLREACAGLGIAAFDPRAPAPGAGAPDVRKCQTDVVATFILTLYEIAIDRGSPDPLVLGWEAISAYLAAMRPRAAHLENFRAHPLLRAARKAEIPLEEEEDNAN